MAGISADVWFAVGAPVSVSVMYALAPNALPPGAYCTTIVQVLPAVITKPLTQVPPVIENAPAAGPDALVTVGVALSVMDVARLFVTVTVPLWVLVLAGVDDNAGLGLLNVTDVGAFTVNGTVPVGPADPITDMVLAPDVVVAGMVQFAVTVVKVGVPVIAQVMAVPAPPMTFTPVAPARPVPVMVTGTVAPCAPLFGLMPLSVGANTVKLVVAVRPFAVTVTVRAVGAAELEMVKDVVMVVAVAVKAFTVTPVPDTVIEVVPARLVPLMVTFTVCPRSALLGVIPFTALMVGEAGAAPPNSNAPASMFGLPASGLTWPRKSSFGASTYAVLEGAAALQPAGLPAGHGGTMSTVPEELDAGAQLPSSGPLP